MSDLQSARTAAHTEFHEAILLMPGVDHNDLMTLFNDCLNLVEESQVSYLDRTFCANPVTDSDICEKCIRRLNRAQAMEAHSQGAHFSMGLFDCGKDADVLGLDVDLDDVPYREGP